jgi:hypothetical protein
MCSWLEHIYTTLFPISEFSMVSLLEKNLIICNTIYDISVICHVFELL